IIQRRERVGNLHIEARRTHQRCEKPNTLLRLMPLPSSPHKQRSFHASPRCLDAPCLDAFLILNPSCSCSCSCFCSCPCSCSRSPSPPPPPPNPPPPPPADP